MTKEIVWLECKLCGMKTPEWGILNGACRRCARERCDDCGHHPIDKKFYVGGGCSHDEGTQVYQCPKCKTIKTEDY